MKNPSSMRQNVEVNAIDSVTENEEDTHPSDLSNNNPRMKKKSTLLKGQTVNVKKASTIV